MAAQAANSGPAGEGTVLVRFDPAQPHPALGATVRKLAAAGYRVVLMGGLGNPKTEFNPSESLAPVARRLGEDLDMAIAFVTECCGSGAESRIAAAAPGSVVMLENLRFQPAARRKGRIFALRLSALGDFYLDIGGGPKPEGGWQDHLAGLLPPPPMENRT